jgi:hypothetical protein
MEKSMTRELAKPKMDMEADVYAKKVVNNVLRSTLSLVI